MALEYRTGMLVSVLIVARSSPQCVTIPLASLPVDERALFVRKQQRVGELLVLQPLVEKGRVDLVAFAVDHELENGGFAFIGGAADEAELIRWARRWEVVFP